MFEQPAESSGPAFWISGPADCVESEANAKNSSDHPVGDGMTAEVEENPSRDHGNNGTYGRAPLIAPQRGQDKRLQAQQSVPHFRR